MKLGSKLRKGWGILSVAGELGHYVYDAIQARRHSANGSAFPQESKRELVASPFLRSSSRSRRSDPRSRFSTSSFTVSRFSQMHCWLERNSSGRSVTRRVATTARGGSAPSPPQEALDALAAHHIANTRPQKQAKKDALVEALMAEWLKHHVAELEQRQVLAGHARAGTTARNYEHLSPNYLREAVAEIDAFFDELKTHTKAHLRYAT